MNDVVIKPDYTNGQFHIWQDGNLVETKLPAEMQAALLKQVVSDCCESFKQVLSGQLSEHPPGIYSLMPH